MPYRATLKEENIFILNQSLSDQEDNIHTLWNSAADSAISMHIILVDGAILVDAISGLAAVKDTDGILITENWDFPWFVENEEYYSDML